MKKYYLLGVFGLSLLAACSKKDDGGGDPNPPANNNYVTFNQGETRTYDRVVAPATTPQTYTLTTSNRDSLVEGAAYKVFENDNGPNEYFNINGIDYSTFLDLGGFLSGPPLNYVYLKFDAPVGTTWTKSFSNIDIAGVGTASGTLKLKIEEKGLTRIVNDSTFQNVIRVSSSITNVSITLPGIPVPMPVPSSALTTDIQNYYAPRVGLIENATDISVDFQGVQQNVNTTTKIKAYHLL